LAAKVKHFFETRNENCSKWVKKCSKMQFMIIIVYSTFPPAYLAYLAVGLLTDKRDKRDVLSFHLIYIIGYGKTIRVIREIRCFS